MKIIEINYYNINKNIMKIIQNKENNKYNNTM